MTNLSININKIAWLRNARDGDVPNLVDLTNKIIKSGCHGITVHPRPDLRHITPKDVSEIKIDGDQGGGRQPWEVDKPTAMTGSVLGLPPGQSRKLSITEMTGSFMSHAFPLPEAR